MRKALTLIIALAIALSAFACGNLDSPPPPEGNVVATVNDIKITDQQVLKMLEAIRDPRQLMRLNSLEGKKMLIDKIIDMELVAAAARREGMQNDIEVRQIIEHYTKQVLFVAYLQKKLTEQTGEADEAAAQAFYNEHPDEFQREERIKVSHILIEVASDADDAAVKKAEKQALSLLKKIKAGADFAEAAKANSADARTREKGGSLGLIARGRMGDEFDEAAFGLAEPGLVANVVRGKKGFHIIKVEEKIPAGPIPFEEIKARIIQKLKMQTQQDAYDNVMGELRSTASINVDEEAVGEISIPLPAGLQGFPGMQPNLSGAAPATP